MSSARAYPLQWRTLLSLLSDLIEYRKDKEAVDLSAKPTAYGAVAVATGVEGVELLAEREGAAARQRRRGRIPEAVDEWHVREERRGGGERRG